MTHRRVTPEGQMMGANAARLAELGKQRLIYLGLAEVRAPRVREAMCTTCACQRGSVPNGCLQTQLDFLKAVVEGTPFLCHAPHDGRLCAGWVQARAEIAGNPPPPELVALIAKHKFSPPDVPEADFGNTTGNQSA